MGEGKNGIMEYGRSGGEWKDVCEEIGEKGGNVCQNINVGDEQSNMLFFIYSSAPIKGKNLFLSVCQCSTHDHIF